MYQKKENLKINSNNGITLIALVVTIIVLLILAGITIAMLNGKNGILTNAKDSVSLNAYGKAEEQSKLEQSNLATKKYTNPEFTTEDLATEAFNDLKVDGNNTEGFNDVSYSTSDNTIYLTYVNKSLKQGLKSAQDGKVIFKIVIDEKGVHLDGEIAEVDYNKINNLVSKTGKTNNNSGESEETASTSQQHKLTGVYWFLYSNNSDNTDLTLAFNSTGIPAPADGQSLYKNGKDISGDISQTMLTANTRPYKDDLDSITSVKIEDAIAPQYMNTWFMNLTKITELDLTNIFVNNVISMNQTFEGCTKLTKIDLSSWDTSNVNSMYRMFKGCSKLNDVNSLSSFKTNNVINMIEMFSGCSSLSSLDLSNFDTHNCEAMSSMFSGCSTLGSIKFSDNFSTAKVGSMESMFEGCSKLTGLNLLNWNTEKVKLMDKMFKGCTILTSLDLSSWNTSNVTDMRSMFNNCKSLTKLDLGSWNTSKVTDMRYMFYGCSGLSSITFSDKFDTSSVTNMSCMFYLCTNITSLDLSSFKTGNVTDMSYMFSGYEDMSLTTIQNLEKIDTSKVTNMHCMFQKCANLTGTITIRGQVTDYGNMFLGTSTSSGTKFTVNYTSSTSSIVDGMIKKANNRHIVKGSNV